MFKRNIKDNLKKALDWNPVVLLIGARQTGKTTLMKDVCKEKNFNYVTFDDIQQQAFAKSDPVEFIKALKKPVILDEIQRVPEIFLTIKKDVDENRQPGMYALTGSANPLLIPRLGDSLAGRMGILNLYPLSQGEIIGIKEDFIAKLFSNHEFENPKAESREEIFKKINIGGYPSVVQLEENEFKFERLESWFNSYVTTILQRDVKDISNISDIPALSNLFHILATRTGNLLNMSELSRISKIPNTTLSRYLSLLETIFLVYFLNTWSNNLETRLVKSPKAYLNDTGLLSFLLGINFELTNSEGRINGPVLENFVFNELQKQASWSSKRVKLFYFRNVSGVEVDIVIQDAQGNIACIEIKGSSTVSPSDFKGLRYLRDNQTDKQSKFIKGVVLYLGDQIINVDKDLIALPITTLWS